MTHPQYVTRPTWGLHRACPGLPPTRRWRCGRNAADAQADGIIGSEATATCYARSQSGSARAVISDSHQINRGDKRHYIPDIIPSSSSLKRSTSAPRYQPRRTRKSFSAFFFDVPVSSRAVMSRAASTVFSASECSPALDCAYHTTVMVVPARLSQASDTAGLFSNSSRSDLDALAQPICSAAGHTRGT